MKRNQQGFTLIEILMVVMLVAIMALVAIPQYLDFQVKAKDEATRGALGALRTAIANQKAQRTVKCNAPADMFPTEASVIANDITTTDTDTYCSTGATIPVTLSAADKPFISGSFPANPWTEVSTVTACAQAACTTGGDRSACAAAGDVAAGTLGWCYDDVSGVIFAGSSKSTGGTTENNF